MKASDLANQIEDLILSANNAFADDIIKVQESLYSKLLLDIKELDVDADGYILQTAKNRKVLNDTETTINDVFASSKYQQALSAHLAVINQINALNAEYFNSISDSFVENRVFISSLQNQAIDTIETYLMGDGLGFQVKTPLLQIINQNVNTGGNYSGFLQQLRTFINGNADLDGRLLSYSRGLLRDTLFNYARAYQNSVTNDLGLEFYLYSGGLMDKSREFCKDRAGQYFHELEIESWAQLDWQGKNPLTTKSSIFILVGGFSCLHQLIPVHISIVPSDAIKRAEELGFYKE